MAEAERTQAEQRYDLARTTAFSDGVFAIAITLVVLTIDVPQLSSGQMDQLPARVADMGPQFWVFLLSFAVVGRFWVGHHSMFAALGRIDGTLTVLNLAYLAGIAFMPVPTELLGEYGDEPIAVVVYALTLSVAGMLAWLMIWHSHRAHLYQVSYLPEDVRRLLRSFAVPWLVFAVSAPVALVSTTATYMMWVASFLHGSLTRFGRMRHSHLPDRRDPQRDHAGGEQQDADQRGG